MEKKKLANTLALLTLAMVLMAPLSARASDDGYDEISIPCTWTWLANNTSHQYGGGPWLEYIVETLLTGLPCQIGAVAEGNVPGVPGSSLRGEGFLSGSARKPVLLPRYGTWQVDGRHSRHSIVGEFFLRNTVSFADIKPPQIGNNHENMCLEMGGYFDEWGNCQVPNSPIIIDTGRNGYRLTSVEDGVYFDLNADGIPEKTAWTAPDSGLAFLVMDRNGNGVIDDGTELFGNHTPVREGQTASNGFEALNFLATPLTGMVEGRAAAWPSLMLWVDANHNGISEPGELRPLAGSGITGIATTYKEIGKKDRFGNEFRQRGQIVWEDGKKDFAFDVWFAWENPNPTQAASVESEPAKEKAGKKNR